MPSPSPPSPRSAAEPPKLARARNQTRLEESRPAVSSAWSSCSAGERLGEGLDAGRGEQLGKLVARYEPCMPKGTGRRFNDAPGQIDARARYEAAIQAVGKWLSPILVRTSACRDRRATRRGRGAPDRMESPCYGSRSMR